jgi:Putative metal-binding motif
VRLRIALLAALASLLLAAPAGATFIQELSPPFTDGSLNGQDEIVGMTLGPDGNIWAVNFDADRVARITPSGQLTEFAFPNLFGLRDITLGPDGNFWVSAANSGGFGIMSTTGQVVKECTNLQDPLNPGGGNLSPESITRVGDRVWFSSGSGQATLASFDANCVNPLGRNGGSGVQFTQGIDGSLWWSSIGTSRISRLDNPNTASPTEVHWDVSTFPGDMVDGPNGRVWFTLRTTNQIGSISKTASIDNTTLDVFTPPAGQVATPFGIAAGPDGNLWFTSRDNARIGRLTPAGAFTTFATGISPGSQPGHIVAGPDADLWFGELRAKRVGRILPDQPPRPRTGAGTPTSPSTATVAGQVDPRGAATHVVVEYGTTTAYGSTAQAGDVPAGIGSVDVSAVLSGLIGKTTYHFRVTATSPGGTVSGADGTFITPPGTSGVDNDGDGISPPADCNDRNPAIRPGAHDIPGNKVDEDCNGKDARFPLLRATITSFFQTFATHTVVTKLAVNKPPARTTIRITCKGRGCPHKRTVKVKKGKRQVKLTKFVGKAKLKPGARLEVRVTRSATVGRVRRITVRSGKLPRIQDLCLPPGARKPRHC